VTDERHQQEREEPAEPGAEAREVDPLETDDDDHDVELHGGSSSFNRPT
jgi:hypothetical protein